MTQLGSLFQQACVFAFQQHQHQHRKGSGVPYVAHLLGVCSIVMEWGGTEAECIAALLHDVIEDQGVAFETLTSLFGADVAHMVLACSDGATPTIKLPWRQRKQQYLDSVPGKSDSAILVSLADKLYNAEAIVQDLHRVGTTVWQRFSPSREDVLWYYESLVTVFKTRVDDYRIRRLEQAVSIMKQWEMETGNDP